MRVSTLMVLGLALWACDAQETQGPSRTLTRTDVLAAGAPCAAGGSVTHTGRDRDADGQLDDDEVEQEQVACLDPAEVDDTPAGDRDTTPRDVFEGDLRIEVPEDVALYTGLREVTGSLFVAPSQAYPIALPGLEHVGGDVRVARGTSSVSLPALQSVGGSVLVADARASMPWLIRFEAPQLAHVGASCEVSARELDVSRLAVVTGQLYLDAPGPVTLPELVEAEVLEIGAGTARVSAPRLSTAQSLTLPSGAESRFSSLRVLRHLTVYAGGSLRGALDMPALEQASSVELQPNANLVHVALPRLEHASALRVIGTNGLTELSLPVAKDMDLLQISDTSLLTRVKAPRLEAVRSTLQVRDNAVLHTLDLPALTTACAVLITGNPRFPACVIDSLLEALYEPPAQLVRDGNDDAASCDGEE